MQLQAQGWQKAVMQSLCVVPRIEKINAQMQRCREKTNCLK